MKQTLRVEAANPVGDTDGASQFYLFQHWLRQTMLTLGASVNFR